MRRRQLIFLGLSWTIALGASGASVPSTPVAEGKAPLHRPPLLSWAPYDYLRQGYRNAPWVKDPFFPESNGFRLSGIISDEMAFINGRWLRVGDKIDGYEVKVISGKGVTLKRQGELIQLKIEQ